MAEKLTFTSVEIDSFGRNSKGIHAKLSASLNSDVIDKMEWGEIPEFLTGSDLEGEVTAISLQIIPSDSSLKRHAIELDLARLSEFKTVRREIEGKKGKGHRTELWFKLFSQDVAGASKLEPYFLTANSKSRLVVSYEKQPKQADIPGTEADTGCIACNNGIPLQEGNPKKHETGQKCTARPVQTEMTN